MLDNAVQHALAGRQAGRAVCGANGLHQDCRSSDHASLVVDVTVDEVLAEALDLLATETARHRPDNYTRPVRPLVEDDAS